MEITTKNAEETKTLGRKIGDKLGYTTHNKEHRNNAVVLALVGELGSGKTTFIQGLAEGLGIEKRILSPTFIIVRTYNIEQTKKRKKSVGFTNFYHVDLYRLGENIEIEMENLGMDEILANPDNIVAIEWAEKAKSYLPDNTIWIEFDYSLENRRTIKVEDEFLDKSNLIV